MNGTTPESHSPDLAAAAIGVAVVVIGRNEGERLHRCLDSIARRADFMVYVDSGSTDDSIAAAAARGAVVVSLDESKLFTAARARNAGFRHVRQAAPHIRYVQFVDGDCEVAQDWLSTGARFLDENANVAAVTGRRRELFPERSVYNWMCEVDWDRKPGEVRECGGDVMVRVNAFELSHGYRDDMIAGEEPELCVRMRANGWTIWRLTTAMTVHDANMIRFSQWWQRSIRTGFAFAEGAHLHGAIPERHWVKESRSAWFWGIGLPLFLALAVAAFGLEGMWLAALYLIQIWRVARRSKGTPRQRLIQGWFVVLGKFPQSVGQLKFLAKRLAGTNAALIEYK
jgi:glycosyltransferase involved in cell wall biosynthesis